MVLLLLCLLFFWFFFFPSNLWDPVAVVELTWTKSVQTTNHHKLEHFKPDVLLMQYSGTVDFNLWLDHMGCFVESGNTSVAWNQCILQNLCYRYICVIVRKFHWFTMDCWLCEYASPTNEWWKITLFVLSYSPNGNSNIAIFLDSVTSTLLEGHNYVKRLQQKVAFWYSYFIQVQTCKIHSVVLFLWLIFSWDHLHISVLNKDLTVTISQTFCKWSLHGIVKLTVVLQTLDDNPWTNMKFELAKVLKDLCLWQIEQKDGWGR